MLAMLLIISIITIAVNCRGKVECVPPPPFLQLWLTNANGSPAVDSSNAKQTTIGYFRNGKLTSLNDARVEFFGRESYVQSYEVIRVASASADTIRFYIAIGNRPAGVFQLKTYLRNTPCDKSTQSSELRYNGTVIPYDNMKPGYTLVVP